MNTLWSLAIFSISLRADMRGVVGGLGMTVKLRMLDILRILNILSTYLTDSSLYPLPSIFALLVWVHSHPDIQRAPCAQ